MTRLIITGVLISVLTACVLAQPTEFSYQGRLMDNGVEASGPYDLEFRLFSTETGGTPLGNIVLARPAVQVAAGIFTVRLDFGNLFDGSSRWLEISLKPTSGSTFTLLTPRQPISSTPHSIRSAIAENVSGVVPIANGGTGSATKSFVDLSTSQNISGSKTFNSAATFNGATTVAGSNNTLSVEGSLNVDFNVTADQFFGDGANLTNLNVVLNTTIVSVAVPVPITSIGNATASCSGGSKVVGGGFSIPDGFVNFSDLIQSRPVDDGSGWIVRMRNTGNSLSLPVTVWAICARVN